MRNTTRLTLASLLLLASTVVAAPVSEEVAERLKSNLAPHPRLIFSKGTESALKEKLKADPQLQALSDLIIKEADRLLTVPPSERVMIGRRLLHTSRAVLQRVSDLGYAYRLTGDRRYADRAKAEMLAAAAFTDWNPSHFLDVGEMTAAFGLGYDWLYDALSDAERQTLRTAIIEKGLNPGLKPGQNWSRLTNNWNQVCNGGLSLGALAIGESEPALAGQILTQAVEGLPFVMKQYGPDGAYPEGPSYWEYGTTYNVLLNSALESALGTDFGLSAQPGFLATADYFLHVTGPTGNWFNYCDCGDRGNFNPAAALFWFAAKRNDPTLLFNERKLLARSLADKGAKPSVETLGFLPFLLAWAPSTNAPAALPTRTAYVAAGPTPLAMFRSSWDDNATFAAIKGGSPGFSHGHMDVGSFIVETDGVRWAEDLGAQQYESLESKKVDLWNMRQDSQRWQVFRLSAEAHNILTVDGNQQSVTARSGLLGTGKTFVTLDTTSAYKGQLASARRGLELRADKSVRIQDDLTATEKGGKLRWAMVTRAEVKPNGDNTVTLTRNGKSLTLRLAGAKATWKTYSTDGKNDFDAKNPGTQMVGFDLQLEPDQKLSLAVDFLPAGVAPSSEPPSPLTNWKK